jgi:tryptophan synthase beta chain
MTELLERPASGTIERAPGTRRRSGLGILGEIAERRRTDLEAELARYDPAEVRRLLAVAPPARDLLAPLLRPGLHLIGELKRRSPSAGRLTAEGVDLVDRARAYERGGAAIISVLVEPHWFAGSFEDLRAVRRGVAVPLLAKEFVVDGRQLPLLRAAGADGVLLLAALHDAAGLRTLVRAARRIGLEPLVEVHRERELPRALASGARLIGLNNRDLRTLAVDPGLAARLRSRIPDDRLVVGESGVDDPAALAEWRALGLDAALVGEALMTAGDGAAAVEARVAAFVAAGREPAPSEDPAAADRLPFVKICGITDEAGIFAAIRADADAIGLNLVPGTPRALSEREAARLAGLARSASTLSPRRAAPRPGLARTVPGLRSLLVGVVADRQPAEAAALAQRLGLDALQLSGDEPPGSLEAVGIPCFKVLHLPSEAGRLDRSGLAELLVERARTYLAEPNCLGILLDTAEAGRRGGTGQRVDPALAAAVAREVPVILAGGLDAASVGPALRGIPAVGVDVASGVERSIPPRARRPAARRPRKDPVRVGLFAKRAKAARLDRPQLAVRPTPVDPGLLEADVRGRWGTERSFGGRYVPETLMAALVELQTAYDIVRHDPRFWARLRELGRDYVGRPSALYRADRLAAALERRAGRQPGDLRLFLKREDLDHTGAHKITNALGQALLARRLGKRRIIAETGAGQHGVATATACALLDLPCVVYMGTEDVRRQAPNVLRMRALGAEVREVATGSATLKDAINEAMRDWVTNVATTHYVLGSAVGPHPYPTIVRDLQRVIGDEAAAQLAAVEGRLPDVAVACLGGGSNAIGLFSRFIGEQGVRLVGVEAAGEGIATGRHAAALAGGSPGVLHGSRSYLLQDADGQVVEAHSISAGLDYPGIGPQLSALYEAGRLEVLAASDGEALEALRLTARREGILAALEPAHAIAALPRLIAGDGIAPLPDRALVLLGLSGRGDKDLGVLGDGEERVAGEAMT